MSVISAPACPDIIVDGTQLILRLDTAHDACSLTKSDCPQQQHHRDDASTSTTPMPVLDPFDPMIGSCHDLQANQAVQDLLPSGIQVSAYTRDLLDSFNPEISVADGKGFTLHEGISHVQPFQTDPDSAPVVDFSIGEQVLTVTQQVSVNNDNLNDGPGIRNNKVQHAIRIIWNGLTSQLGLVLLLIMYTFTGAAVFTSLENKGQFNESLTLNHTSSFLNALITKGLRSRGESVHLNISDIADAFDEYLQVLELHLCKTSKQRHDYWRWLLFCITTYTTIGYGHIVPTTSPGKIACIIYSVIGIPLFLMTMGKLGKLFTKGLKIIWSCARQLYYINYCRNVRRTRRLRATLKKQNRKLYADNNGNRRHDELQDYSECNETELENKETNTEVHEKANGVYNINPNADGDGPVGAPAAAPIVDDEESNANDDVEENGKSMKIKCRNSQQYSSADDIENQLSAQHIEEKRNNKLQSPKPPISPGIHTDSHSQNSYKSFVVDDTYDLPPWVSIIIWTVYILFGASMYSSWEKSWSYLDAVYFVFVSISTIGYGDIVPTQNVFFLVTSVYILFGLALVAMIINVLIEFFAKTIEHVHKTVTHIHVPAILKKPISDIHVQESGGQKHFAMKFKPPTSTKKKVRVRFSRQRRASM